MKVHHVEMISVPVAHSAFEARLLSVCRRWHKRSVEDISALCSRMGVTRDQRVNAIRAYMAERQRHE